MSDKPKKSAAQPETPIAPASALDPRPSTAFTCPYCGPDENGAEIHALTHHTQPPFTVEQAQQILAADEL